MKTRIPLGRIGQPQDIAPAAVYLASDDSAFVTGETLTITAEWDDGHARAPARARQNRERPTMQSAGEAGRPDPEVV